MFVTFWVLEYCIYVVKTPYVAAPVKVKVVPYYDDSNSFPGGEG